MQSWFKQLPGNVTLGGGIETTTGSRIQRINALLYSKPLGRFRFAQGDRTDRFQLAAGRLNPKNVTATQVRASFVRPLASITGVLTAFPEHPPLAQN